MTKIEFVNTTYQLLEEKDRVLVFLRIPNSGNNRHYFFVNQEDFDDLMRRCNPSDSITIFRSINLLNSGIVSNKFIESFLKSTSQDNFKPELVVLKDNYNGFKEKGYSEWAGVENMNELEEYLSESIGEYVSLLGGLDFCDELNTIHLYFPDKNGLSKPGNAY